jgi:hypothetical protein
MSYTTEAVIKHMITQNNHNMNISFPAVVVNTDSLKDGLIDVQPLVNYTNPLTLETISYPTIYSVSVVFPSTQSSTICFPLQQGDFVDLLIQSVDIQKFVSGSSEIHDADMLSHGNLSNVVAYVGFAPYQKSPFNPNNYSNDFDNQDLNIVHNKNTDNEVSITLKPDGDVVVRSPTRVVVESKEVQVLSDTIEANNAVINTQGDVVIEGRSVKQFMAKHTHTGNKGAPTSAPLPL